MLSRRAQAQVRVLVPRAVVGSSSSVKLLFGGLRGYHDESFGYRPPPKYAFPDYTQKQLSNRHHNATLLRYVDSMRTHGHRAARIDPLDLIHRDEVAALDPTRYGLTERGKRYDVDGILWTKRVGDGEGEELWTLEEIERHLRGVYVGKIGYEYMHSPSKTERLWFSHLLESQTLPSPADKPLLVVDEEKKRRIHELLAKSEVLDHFLQAKFPNLKRYGLEGGESMLPALDTLFSSAAQGGIQHIILAMPHRGRLNLLTDLLQYSPTVLFHKIRGGSEWPEELGAEGDVLSHIVSSPTLQYEGAENPLKVSLLPNPSHLEAANPVALGKTRAKQFSLLKTSPQDCQLGDKVMCVQLHGDASFTGQGVVMESLGLSNLPHFTSGGSVHLVVDNNIGYTTPASGARSSAYCSDVGKAINAPVLHVNGDHPEDVARAMDIAFRYRNYFRKDIIVDLLVYRRWGHNELDLPGITSPLMYEKIAARKSVPELYEHKLLSENIVTQEDISIVRSTYKSHLESQLSNVPTYTPPPSEAPMLQDQWSGIVWPKSAEAAQTVEVDTGVEKDVLKRVGEASVWAPDGFEIHSKLGRHVKNRLSSLEKERGVDWATAEALAFGSLMLEGYDVRISGQDVGRGTFSHRHAMLVDQKTERVVVPLNEVLGAEGKLELANSSLSEFAVLGFEYGASWERPTLLPIWEAQFGDFFNGAQVIIDTYISSSETKWLKQSGIVLQLPHGLDGAGPEHSSSRVERMLQLTNDRYAEQEADPTNINMHVVFPTTPAQYFHLLRRQMKRGYRKPLVIVGPKGLLRLAPSLSALADLEPGTRFQPVLQDPLANPSKTKRIVLLTGKFYYELIKEREARNLVDEVSFVRIEELAPFPFSHLREILERYGDALNDVEVCWVQEEPRNQGAWGHVKERIEGVLEDAGVDVRRNWLGFKGRKESAIPAPGIGKIYAKQQRAVIESAFEGL
ncbi:2-oxoglutarate dehydrogenase, E1 component [Macrolepiota fuliginosa MF-IS2]|uniref:2-oxoglutarate dehydrogenase, E1 component n=1 Tax=Macrolepiota fuliginosa MF-IS2 TaxID=1400762 RepID=A0A9P5X8A5_9AGAR|nr:2-oxoglutarate dehydrogenase, E1 component [Macrolepiota fuliginosa MF-IS2]